MDIKTLTVIPESLRRLPQPPKQLFNCGAELSELLKRPCVAIVGSRKPTAYGRQVTQQFSQQLAERGVVIISGLALGIDGLAHQGALEAGGLTLAVLPSPLNNIVPATNRRLADRILASGGALLSEYAPGVPIDKYTFVARNRLVAGLANAVLITEAGSNSGSRHTAGFASGQEIPVLAVPGNITSSNSAGTNDLLVRHKASPVTSVSDVLAALNLPDDGVARPRPTSQNPHEQLILDLLGEGVTEGEHLFVGTQLPVSEFNQALTMLEIRGHIRPLGANRWSLKH